MSEMISVYIMGKKYTVPAGLTIMRALEYSGQQLVRGCGCRGGFCGACGTIYRLPGDYRLHVGMACETPVKKDMVLTTLPFFPALRADYNLEEMSGLGQELTEKYPEGVKCIGCNSCTKICSQDLPVMNIMQYVQRGDLDYVANHSFDCIMCGLCASRCPASIAPYNIFMLARRLYGRYQLSKPEYIENRRREIEDGKYIQEIEVLKTLSQEDLQKRYATREMEKL